MESKEKIEQLKKELQQAEENFRKEKKNLKANFQTRRALIKGDLTKIEKTLDSKKESLKSRVVWHMDSLTLRICRPFEEKAADIRYKRFNPEGYEADQVFLASGPILKHLQKKLAKGKELSKREQDLASKLFIAFTAISQKRLGRYHEEAQSILEELRTIVMPSIPPEVKEQLESVLGTLNDLFAPATANNYEAAPVAS